MSKLSYEDAGVNIDAGNETVELIKSHVKTTFNNNVLTGIGSFGSLFSLKDIKNYDDPVLVQSIDGVGTKTKVAVMANKFENLGYDLFSAACNDIIVMGAKPITFLDYVAHDKLEPKIMEQLVKGMSKACSECDVALVGGETAEMPGVYQQGEIDMVGVITGVCEKDKVVDGKNIKLGDDVFGIKSSGLHTNGYSFARKLFFEIGGYNINDEIEGIGNIGDALLKPHINYTNFVHGLLEKCDVSGFAHITGGGLIENVPRVMPNGVGVEIDINSWDVPNIFKKMQQIGDVSEFEMYRSFNMGIGFVVIGNEDIEGKIAKVCQNCDLEYVKIGKVVNEEGVKLI